MAARKNARQARKETLAAANAQKALGVNDEMACFFKAIQVAHLAQIPTLANQSGSLAVRTTFRGEPRRKLDMNRGGCRLLASKGVVPLQAYI